MSYRVLANNAALYAQCKRDNQIEAEGIPVLAMLPTDPENPVDFFGDGNVTNRVDELRYIIPLYDQYYSLIDIVGEDIERPLPLECIVKTSDHWIIETIFRLPVRNALGDLVDRYWRVANSVIKHLEVYTDKKIICVPARNNYDPSQGIN